MALPNINADEDPGLFSGGNDFVYEPLQSPPTDYDEFAGFETAIEAQQGGLEEPPFLSGEEADEYLNNFGGNEDFGGEGIFDSDTAGGFGFDGGGDGGGSFFSDTGSIFESGVMGTQLNSRANNDWRVRLSLARGANYLYNEGGFGGDILAPLAETGGVIFPYTPSIQVGYRANYDSADIAHSNYRQYFYKNSSVDDVQITADFTAQDTQEANYLLAVIHFLRSVTKMFYGKDENPTRGIPPPLCYITGLGQYQFNNHPVAVTSFTYSLPNDVDYIRAGSTTQYAGQNYSSFLNKPLVSSIWDIAKSRLFGSSLTRGGFNQPPSFNYLSNSRVTYVPTKMQIQIGMIPIVSRKDISNNFSLKDYGSGKLLRRGIW